MTVETTRATLTPRLGYLVSSVVAVGLRRMLYWLVMVRPLMPLTVAMISRVLSKPIRLERLALSFTVEKSRVGVRLMGGITVAAIVIERLGRLLTIIEVVRLPMRREVVAIIVIRLLEILPVAASSRHPHSLCL